MRRIHCFEFEDLPWFPKWLRKMVVEHLEWGENLFPQIYHSFAEKLGAALQQTGQQTIVDLCSGGAGPIPSLLKQLARVGYPDTQVVLTDLYPNPETLERICRHNPRQISYRREPVDAGAVPAELIGLRLLCNGFHHMPQNVATAILRDAVVQRQGIALLEMIGRSPRGIITLVNAVSLSLISAVCQRPVRLARLFWTYVIPLVPLIVLWDGTVSCLRIYSCPELRELVQQVDPNGLMTWEIGTISLVVPPMQMTYLIGIPKGQP